VQAALTGPWRPTPSKLMCESCPALGLLCAGTDLPSAHG
jgi:hypothetical protein